MLPLVLATVLSDHGHKGYWLYYEDDYYDYFTVAWALLILFFFCMPLWYYYLYAFDVPVSATHVSVHCEQSEPASGDQNSTNKFSEQQIKV